MLADSGAQVDCVSRDKLKPLGLNEYSLLKAEMSLGCANGSDAGIIGAFFGKVALKDKANNAVVRELFYVLKKGGNLLSRTTLTKLGLLTANFPLGGSQQCDKLPVWPATQGQMVVAGNTRNRQSDGDCDPDSPLPCSCPMRVQVQVPKQLPYAPTMQNRQHLQDWIKILQEQRFQHL